MLLKSDYSAQWLGDCTVQELVAQRNSLLIACGTIRTMLGPAVTEYMAVELHEQFTRKYDQDIAISAKTSNSETFKKIVLNSFLALLSSTLKSDG